MLSKEDAHNPISLYVEKPKSKIVCLRNYPIDDIVGYVRDYFRLGDNVRNVDSDENEQIMVRFPNVERNCELVKKALHIADVVWLMKNQTVL